MKKFKSLIILLIVLVIFPIGVNAKDKINVYLFRRNGCGFCEQAIEFFTSLGEDSEYKNYFNLVQKEVSTDADNAATMNKVAGVLGVELKGVPFIVIGEKYFEGYTSAWNDNFKKAIKDAYNNSSYKDIVAANLTTGTSTSNDGSSSTGSSSSDRNTYSNESKDNDAAVTIIILFATIGGIAFLVYMAREGAGSETVKTTKEKSSKVEVKKADNKRKKNNNKTKKR